jgi:hypothetical protein
MLIDGWKAYRFFPLLSEKVLASPRPRAALGLLATMERQRRSYHRQTYGNKKNRDRTAVLMLAERGTCDVLEGIKPYIRPNFTLNQFGQNRLEFLRGNLTARFGF